MIRTILILVTTALLSSCARSNYPQQSFMQSVTTTVTETVHDTIIVLQPDSSILQALIECDSTGRAYLKEIDQLKSSATLHQNLHLEDNVLTATANVDSMDIYLTYKDRYQTTTNTTTEARTVTVTTNILKPWQKLLMYLGAMAALAIIIKLFLRRR